MKILTILVFICATISSHALDAQFSGTSLVIRDSEGSFTIPNLVDEYCFHRTLHAIQKRGSTYYVVYGTSELSRGWPPKNGYCGAGIESWIEWLCIQDEAILERQIGLYESCMQNRFGYAINWSGDLLTWMCSGLDYEYTWKYDPVKPHEGIKEIKAQNNPVEPTR